MLAAKEREESAWIHAGKRNEAVSNRVGCSSLQVGSCLTPATNLPKALPLDSGECSALRFSHFAKGKKTMKKNSGRKTRFQQRRTLRLTVEEDERLSRQAATAGISVSEYMRRLFFGGRPIVAKTDGQTIRELRRLGGLLKHHFETVRAAGRPEDLEAMNRALLAIRLAIEALSKAA
ncbi:hypothetical protein [uncultured Bilophila sp.]|uniref:plasmid mobilization protein n=3 Tax=uncultured Bilophila sp. TaxID=529385 RepID=UPI00261CBA22|nr:hypothetical protein [uncultured Bilophila sp.]